MMQCARYCLVLLLLSVCLRPAMRGQDAAATTESGRKILRQVTPRYPDLARRMNLSGVVKVIAVVAPDGKVKAVQPVGGSPILLQAAQDAVSEWKFAPASAESKESIELHFHPQ
jgi:TonB family protein